MATVIPLASRHAAPRDPDLSLLLHSTEQALDRLWMHRMTRDTGVLMPEFLDPGLCFLMEGAADAEGAALRTTLLELGARMRQCGLAAVARAVLRMARSARRRRALLALAGSAAWRRLPGGPGEEHWLRPAAEGRSYQLTLRLAGDCAHAPQALRDLAQTLRLRPASRSEVQESEVQESEVQGGAVLLAAQEGGLDCLSLQAALRDVTLALGRQGETVLAAGVAALREDGPDGQEESAGQASPGSRIAAA
ncbi:hypothetical protein [Pseudoroseomonas sp. WGS1072]|uniref:hypothetical protein n=1 Tax=Roseomonas sp. WGS1072 TaxID=3366816 RepID=UPI003BF2C525